MSLPIFVDADHLKTIQPLPRSDRRRIAGRLTELGLFRPDVDYSEEKTFYSELLALYSRGPGGLQLLNREILAFGQGAISRRRLASSFSRFLSELNLSIFDELFGQPTFRALLIVAGRISLGNRIRLCLDCLWIAWLYGANITEIRNIINSNIELKNLAGDWPTGPGLSIDEVTAGLAADYAALTDSEFHNETVGPIADKDSKSQLKALLNSLKLSRSITPAINNLDYTKNLAKVQAHLGAIPLLHGTSNRYFAEIWQAKTIRSRKQLGLPELNHQHCFGTYGAVYASVGVMYPQRQAAFALSADIEKNPDVHVDACPWDSGTFYSHISVKLGFAADADRARVYQEQTLSAPLYRVYLSEYVTTCFANTNDYLRGQKNVRGDPLRAMVVHPDDLLGRVFEAHLSPALRLRPDQVEAVFLSSPRHLSRELRERTLPSLREAGVRVEYYGRPRARRGETNATSADLQRYVTEWMCARVEGGKT